MRNFGWYRRFHFVFRVIDTLLRFIMVRVIKSDVLLIEHGIFFSYEKDLIGLFTEFRDKNEGCI